MKKILVAEDNDSNFILMTYILKRFYEFERAKNGQEAVDLVESGAYDLVLMDIKMPVMDGLEATKTIRKMERADAATIPIVALTANAFEEDVQHSMQAGLNAHLTKPVEAEALFEVLTKLLKGNSSVPGD